MCQRADVDLEKACGMKRIHANNQLSQLSYQLSVISYQKEPESSTTRSVARLRALCDPELRPY
ncbi:MAG: hypothetical protein HC862_04480 [Scytonema sp. RU_4_4]|nr:hypothetical protein [Scytonema sp. RU_4_4]